MPFSLGLPFIALTCPRAQGDSAETNGFQDAETHSLASIGLAISWRNCSFTNTVPGTLPQGSTHVPLAEACGLNGPNPDAAMMTSV